MEIWKDIAGYENMYQVSNKGRVKSLTRTCKSKWKTGRTVPEKILSYKIDKYGYPSLHISKDNKRWHVTIHLLVARTFIENPENKPQVNHKDGNKLNNNDWNLEWSTGSENILHSFREGLHVPKKGEDRAMAKLTGEMVSTARKRYQEGDISIVELAKEYPCSPQTLHCAITRKTWKHII